MARPRKFRYIGFEPGVTYFKPRGIPLSMLDEIALTSDELEAVRLKNLEGFEQIKCAKKMKISQSTFQRILTSANKKIAEALILGKAIKIEKGTVAITAAKTRRWRCENCRYEWKIPFGAGKRGREMFCPKCKSRLVHRIDDKGQRFGRQFWGKVNKK